MNPFEPSQHGDRDRPDEPIEAALRDSLAAHARRGPDPDAVTERILAAADRPAQLHSPDRGPRGPWRTWGLPLVAAASVAAIVGGVVALSHYHPSSDHPQAATNGPSISASSPTPSRPASPTKGHLLNPPPSTTQAPSTATSIPVNTSELSGVKVLDVTFTGVDTGFALASANCLLTSGRCTALEQTTNGTAWGSHPNTPFDVPGISAGCPASVCVTHIRFATDQIGYVYGPDALFMTTDGAQTWKKLSGGADALETADQNVIKVSGGGCVPPGCNYTVQIAAIGHNSWTTVTLPGGDPLGDAVTLSRGGGRAYLLVAQNPAGASDNETSTLYRSDNDGATWLTSGEPCAQTSGEVDSYAVAAGLSENVSILCLPRDSTGKTWRVATSSNGGASFTPQAGRIALNLIADNGESSQSVLAGDPATALVVAGNGLTRSTDGGRTWNPVSDVTGRIGFVGFESTVVGRAVSADGRTIWTTYNAGENWTRTTLG